MSEIGDVVILDVDANELKSPFNDLEGLPSDLVRKTRLFYFFLQLHTIMTLTMNATIRLVKFLQTLIPINKENT